MISSDTVIGFLGAGQLARMSALEAFKLGVQVASFSNRLEKEPLQRMTPHSFSGSFDDIDALLNFASHCSVITLENEFIESAILQELEEKSGVPILPDAASFERIENKWIEKTTFRDAGIPVTNFSLVKNRQDIEHFVQTNGWPVILKSSKGGYDGYGNRIAHSIHEAMLAFEQLGGTSGRDILIEAFFPFKMELAVQVARNKTGVAVYPCCESIHENHICVDVLAPARVSPEIRAKVQELAVAAVEAINGVGIFAFEFFLGKDDTLVLNESAPRPHNSGHYTIEGCITSQFENHIRAILGLPLGSTELRKPAAVMTNLLGKFNRNALVENPESTLSVEDAHIHIYGKANSKTGRKMGHITVLGTDIEKTYLQSKTLAQQTKL